MTEPLRVAFAFLTRLPVRPRRMDAVTTGRSLAWYPLVGAVIGLLAAAAVLLAGTAGLLGGALAVAVLVVVSGALHLDGLADSADAWVGGLGDAERTLAIMKDPSCGPVGVATVVVVLLVEFAAVATLAGTGAVAALLVAGVLSRAAAPALFLTTPYLRAAGLGAALAGGADPTAVRLGLLAAAAASLLAGGAGLVALIAAVATVYAVRAACLRRLGGITGDTTGAAMVLVEAVVLVVLALLG